MGLEDWADIRGYEGIYQISTFGRIKSLSRVRAVGQGFRRTKERFLTLKPGIYPTVTLTHLNDNHTFNVHTLVLEAFVGPPPAGMEGCHWDGDGRNCRLDNLRWDYRTENMADKIRHGTTNRGERCGTSKLTSRQVSEIRHRRKSGERQSDLAREFLVAQSSISHIVNGKRWKYEGS